MLGPQGLGAFIKKTPTIIRGKEPELGSSGQSELKNLKRKTQVHSREINLFYLTENERTRIIKTDNRLYEDCENGHYW